jgi:hypothetical protein
MTYRYVSPYEARPQLLPSRIRRAGFRQQGAPISMASFSAIFADPATAGRCS